MKPKTMILMVVAVSCGLGASYMTSRLLADRDQQVEKVTILVAKKALNMGDTIKAPDDWFIDKEVPKGEEPRLAIAEPEKLKGKMLKRPLRQGDFITPDDLVDEKNGGVSYNLPQGHVAVGIRVSQESIAGGFASLPLSRVNIIWTVRRGSDKDSFSKTLLENVLVLAADTRTLREEGGAAMPANVVTVALKPEDSMRLELAKSIGSLSMALRKANDSSIAEGTSVSVETLLRGSNNPATEENSDPGPALPKVAQTPKTPTPPVPAVDNGPGGKNHRLKIYEGDKVNETNYLLDEKGVPIGPGRRIATPPPAGVQPAPATKNAEEPTPGGN